MRAGGIRVRRADGGFHLEANSAMSSQEQKQQPSGDIIKMIQWN